MPGKAQLLGMIGVLLAALPAMTASATSAPPQHTTAVVTTHPSQGEVTEVDGAIATLRANDAGITATLRTHQLEIGHPHTLWVVIINRPDLCEAEPCNAEDILSRTEIVEANITYGGGRVVRGHTTPYLTHVPVGEVEGGWYETPFTNLRGAEIHLALMDHGPLISSLAREMTSTLRAGCTDESVPAAYPPVAVADGAPGPNTCRLVQVAVLQQ